MMNKNFGYDFDIFDILTTNLNLILIVKKNYFQICVKLKF